MTAIKILFYLTHREAVVVFIKIKHIIIHNNERKYIYK